MRKRGQKERRNAVESAVWASTSLRLAQTPPYIALLSSEQHGFFVGSAQVWRRLYKELRPIRKVYLAIGFKWQFVALLDAVQDIDGRVLHHRATQAAVAGLGPLHIFFVGIQIAGLGRTVKRKNKEANSRWEGRPAESRKCCLCLRISCPCFIRGLTDVMALCLNRRDSRSKSAGREAFGRRFRSICASFSTATRVSCSAVLSASSIAMKAWVSTPEARF